MGQIIVSDEQLEDRVANEATSRGPALTAAVQAASDMIWSALGAHPGDDLAYRAGAVERYRHRGGPTLYLRRRPISEVTRMRYFDLDNDVIETLDPTTYGVQDAQRGILVSRLFPDTRTTVLVGYERRLAGRAILNLEVTYTGGWVTRPQWEADNTLTVNMPSDLEEACMQQAIYLWRSRQRDRAISNKSDEASAVGFVSLPMVTGGLLPEVAAVCKRHKRAGDILG